MLCEVWLTLCDQDRSTKNNVFFVRFSILKKMAMDWMLDQTVDKEVKLMSKKFKGGNKKEGKGKWVVEKCL